MIPSAIGTRLGWRGGWLAHVIIVSAPVKRIEFLGFLDLVLT